jgi:hypothetical protein
MGQKHIKEKRAFHGNLSSIVSPAAARTAETMVNCSLDLTK